MSDALKDFIVDNRGKFDTLEPGDLWTKIDNNLAQNNSLFNPKNITNMLKYGFGASALVAGTLFLVNLQQDEAPQSIQSNETVVDSPLRAFKTPRLNAGAVLLTEMKHGKQQTTDYNGLEVTAPVSPEEPSAGASDRQDSIKEPNPVAAAKPALPFFISKQPPKDSLQKSGWASVDTFFNDVKRIEVKLEFCDVNVKAIAGDQVKMHGKIGQSAGSYIVLGRKAYKKTEYELKFEKKDSVLKIWMESRKINEKMLSADIANDRSVIDLEVPARTGIDVNNSSGNVAVSGILNERMHLQTTFGDIKADNITSSLVLKSSSGDITLTRFNGEVRVDNAFGRQVLENVKGNVKLRSSSGGLTIRDLKGNIEASTSFGDQRYENITGAIVSNVSSGKLIMKNIKGNINGRSSFGDQVFEHIEGDINSKASSGDILVDDQKGMLSLGTSFGDIRGTNITLVASAEFKTSSGDIRMKFLNEMSDLRFDLTSSSGDIVVEKGNEKNKSDRKLLLGQGAIVVKGVSSFGDQTYK